MQTLATKTVTATMARRQFPRPVLQFRIYPEGRRKYWYQVEIYKSLPQMREALRIWDAMQFPTAHDHDSDGAFTYKWKPSQHGCIGAILLSLPTMTLNYTSHECFHAVQAWAHTMRFKPASITGWKHPTHERVAEAHGNLMSQLWQEFTKHYPPKYVWGWEKWAAK